MLKKPSLLCSSLPLIFMFGFDKLRQFGIKDAIIFFIDCISDFHGFTCQKYWFDME